MKKIVLSFILVFSIFIFAGCKDKTLDYGSYTFEDKTVQTSQEILDKLNFYIERISEIGQENYEDSYDSTGSSRIFQREELPTSYPYPNAVSIAIKLYDTQKYLLKYKDIIQAIDSFEESTLATYRGHKIKIKLEGNQMFIEEFESSMVNEGLDTSVKARLLYLNLVDDKLYYQFVRDDQSTYIPDWDNPKDLGNNTYYDMFIEDGDSLSLYFDKNKKEDYYYEMTSVENELDFLFSRRQAYFYMKTTDYDLSKTYKIDINQEFDDIEILITSIDYFSDSPGFSLAHVREEGYYLSWNLMEVDGWSSIQTQPDKLFINNQEASSDLHITATVGEYTYLLAELTLQEDAMLENILDLSAYDLYYDQISYEELSRDIEYLNENYLELLNDQGFENDPTKDIDYLLDMLPFHADQDIIDELFAILESE